MASGKESSSPPGASLRGWLRYLAQRERLVSSVGNDLAFDVAACAKAVERKKTVLFRKPGGSHLSIVANLFADRSWIGDAMGVSQGEITGQFLKAAEMPVASNLVDKAHFQQVVETSSIDLLRDLPVPTHNEHDGGPYITAGLLIVRDPETGIQNVSISTTVTSLIS